MGHLLIDQMELDGTQCRVHVHAVEMLRNGMAYSGSSKAMIECFLSHHYSPNGIFGAFVDVEGALGREKT